MKKGFTLIELIGTITILALVSVIVLPAVLNMINASDKKISEANKEYIENVALKYARDYEEETKNGKTYKVSYLQEKGYLTEEYIEKNNIETAYAVCITYDTTKYVYKIC